MPSTPETADFHKELLVLLKVFDDICALHNIKYSLHGGTLLGAIRDKGFIPWDDDADITLTRIEYEKLKKVINEHKGEYGIEVQERNPMIWLRRKSKPAVWIDVLIYDFIDDNKFKQKVKLLGLVFFLGFTKSEKQIAVAKNGEYRGWKYLIIYFLYLLGSCFSMKLKMKWYDKFASSYFNGNKKFILRSNDQYKGLKLILPKEVTEEYIRLPFENIKLSVAKGFHEILSSSYGVDYMVPKKMHNRDAVAHKIIRCNNL